MLLTALSRKCGSSRGQIEHASRRGSEVEPFRLGLFTIQDLVKISLCWSRASLLSIWDLGILSRGSVHALVLPELECMGSLRSCRSELGRSLGCYCGRLENVRRLSREGRRDLDSVRPRGEDDCSGREGDAEELSNSSLLY